MTSNSCFLLLLCLSAFFSYSLQDACTNVTCGQGHCVLDDPLGILSHCECNPGWKTIQIGLMPIGSCIIPNCTLDFSCGGTEPPPPFPPINFTSPCNLVWCGDGDCAVNATGTGHYCQCHERAANLFNDPANVCMQQCYLGGDCKRLGLGPPPPPPPSAASPGPGGPILTPGYGTEPPPYYGKNGASYSLTKLPTVLVAIFTALFLSRI